MGWVILDIRQREHNDFSEIKLKKILKGNEKLVQFKKCSVVIVLSIVSFSFLWMAVYLMPMTFQVDFNDPNFKTPAEPDDIFFAFSGSGLIFKGSKLVTFTKVLHHYRPQFGTVCSVPFGHLGWVF